jgi:bacteriorhodopsin
MHAGYRCAAHLPAPYNFEYYVVATVARWFIAVFVLWEGGTRALATRNNAVLHTWFRCSSVTFIVWLIFPLLFAITDRGNLISADVEAILYGVLDIFSKPVFSALLISGHRDINPSLIGFTIWDYPEFFGGDNIVRPVVPGDNNGKT